MIYFNLAVIFLLVSGIACFAIGLISLIRGYKKKNKEKISRGWRLSILGLVITVVFLPILINVFSLEAESAEELMGSSLIVLILFFPLAFAGIFICLLFYLVIGTTSLKAGYTRDQDGKFDVESIVLGYVMLALGIIVIFSLVMYIIATFGYIGESIKRSNERRYGSSSLDPGSLSAYLFSKIYK